MSLYSPGKGQAGDLWMLRPQGPCLKHCYCSLGHLQRGQGRGTLRKEPLSVQSPFTRTASRVSVREEWGGAGGGGHREPVLGPG